MTDNADSGKPIRRLMAKSHLLALLGIGVVLFLTQPRQPYPGDPNASRAAAVSLFTSMRLDVPHALAEDMGDRGQYFYYNQATDKYYSKYAILNTLSAVLPLCIAKLAGDPVEMPYSTPKAVFWQNLWNIALAMVLAGYLLKLMGFCSSSRITPVLLLVLIFFCTYVWNYLRAQSSEILQMVCYTAATYHLFAWRRTLSADGLPLPGARRQLLSAGLCLSLLVLSKTVYALLLPLAILFAVCHVLKERPGKRIPFGLIAGQMRELTVGLGLPLVACAALVLALNALMYGGAFRVSYTQWDGNRNLFSGDLVNGLHLYLLTVGKGIPTHFPFVILGLCGAVCLWRSARAEITFLVGTLVLFLVVNAKFCDPGGSWCYGPRYLVFCLPAFAAPGVCALDWIVRRRAFVRAALASLLGTVAVVSLIMQLAVNSLLFMTVFQVEHLFRQFTFSDDPRIVRCFEKRHMGMVCLDLLSFRSGGMYEPVEIARAIGGDTLAGFVEREVNDRVFYNYLLRWYCQTVIGPGLETRVRR